MLQTEWNKENAVGDNVSGRVQCTLGINKRTGRLQWCPGCKYNKMILFIPVTMLPILLIFVTVTHLNVVSTTVRHYGPSSPIQTIYNEDLNNNDNNNPNNENNEIKNNANYYTEKLDYYNANAKCVAVRSSLTEIHETEERDLLKDTRTSFIPQDVILVPPDCKFENEWTINKSPPLNTAGDGTNEFTNDKDFNAFFNTNINRLLNFILRRKREQNIINNNNNNNNNNNKNNNSMMNNETSITADNDQLVKEPWTITHHNGQSMDTDEDIGEKDGDDSGESSISITNLNNPNSVFEQTAYILNANTNTNNNNNNNNNNADSAVPPSIHSFWKGEGTADEIRATQADVMLQNMDLSIDPCDDFYQYACGNWEKLNPIPKDKAAYDTFEILRESLDVVLRNLLTENFNINTEGTGGGDINDNNSKGIVEDVVDEKLSNTLEKTTAAFLTGGDVVYNTNNNGEIQRTKRCNICDIKSELKKKKHSRDNNDRRRIIRKRHYNNILIDAETKAKYLYESCMNYELLEKRGTQPLLDLLKSLGGWPALDREWKEENFDWLHLVANLRLYNNEIFIVEWVGPDIKNSDENVIQFDQTSLGLPTRDYFLLASNAQYLDAYKIYMKSIINLLGCELDMAEKISDDIVAFETDLADIMSPNEERTNISLLYKRMTVGLLHEEIPQIDWERYLTIVLERPINSSETVVIFAIDYMKKLVTLLAATDSETIANYLFWRFARHRINNLDDRFQDAKQKFYYVLFGREQSPPRWKDCINQVNSNMGMAVGAMFVRRYFDENSKKDTLDMTYELQESFREILNNTSWIDAPTKVLAELKVNSMSLRIGYPDFLLSPDELNEKYKNLDINRYNYFENTLNVLLHITRTEQNKLGQLVNKTAWYTAPAVVNAYYSRNKNQIMFPAGILQPPFYHRHFPKSINFGGIGVVIGHELTHGFDDKGRLFDREGNLHRWWTDASIDAFHERARCLIAQYSNYTVAEVGLTINGESTQGENIADNGGIKQAFRAYQKWLDNVKNNPDILNYEILPGINATNTQLFFLNFAQVWCGAMRPEATRNKLKTAVHSPGKFRVIGTLSNSDDFAREYQCELGSPMNPIHKCSVW